MKSNIALKLGAALVSLMASGSAMAATSVSWLTPPNGSTYPVGTVVNPTGIASAVGTAGVGLDLALVLDVSGSMGSGANSGMAAQKSAALALVNGLPAASTSVAIIPFNSALGTGVNSPLALTPVSTGLATIQGKINGLSSTSGTNIGAGIDGGSAALTGAGHTAGRTQMMVVISDGVTSGLNPGERADLAIAAGVDSIHSVGVPGHDVDTMKGIVNGPDDNYNQSADNYGIYTNVSNLAQLEALFDGTGGNLVGLDHIDITLPNGTVLSSYPTDGLGNFSLPNWSMLPGANTFQVTAYGSDQTQASASWTLYGERQQNGVPDGGSTVVLLGAAFGALSLLKKKMR